MPPQINTQLQRPAENVWQLQSYAKGAVAHNNSAIRNAESTKPDPKSWQPTNPQQLPADQIRQPEQIAPKKLIPAQKIPVASTLSQPQQSALSQPEKRTLPREQLPPLNSRPALHDQTGKIVQNRSRRYLTDQTAADHPEIVITQFNSEEEHPQSFFIKSKPSQVASKQALAQRNSLQAKDAEPAITQQDALHGCYPGI